MLIGELIAVPDQLIPPAALPARDVLTEWPNSPARTSRWLTIGIAQVYVGLGDRDRALDWLERGVETEMYVAYLAIDPTFRPLHAEPRFRRLLKQVNLDA